jgi:hypothetical protein
MITGLLRTFGTLLSLMRETTAGLAIELAAEWLNHRRKSNSAQEETE